MKTKSVSVGYNNKGQEFFDLLYTYRPFINGFFFSCLHTQDFWNKFDVQDFLKNLYKQNTYDFVANILFNYKRDETDSAYFLIDQILQDGKINLKQVTLGTPQFCEKVRRMFPELEIHLSVHYSKDYVLEDLKGICDCVNLSSVYDFNAFDKINTLKRLGIKVKYILNKGCIPNREITYKHFNGSKNINCELCKQCCLSLLNNYPWLQLARVFYYPEMIERYFQNVDIWKLPTREDETKTIAELLNYFIVQRKTRFVQTLNIENKYYTFLKWIDARVKCENRCDKCSICKDFWKDLTNEPGN